MIQCLRKFEFSHPLNHFRSATLEIHGTEYLLFCVSENRNLDPWPESFGYIDYPLSLVLFDTHGNRMWERTFGRGTIPGYWFTPFVAFDLDRDGADEIYLVHNTDDEHPFSQFHTVLEKIDAASGETVAQYPFPAQNTLLDKMSYAFRHNLSAGYVHGEPVLVTAQGTYTNMFLQAYTTGMKPLWEKVVKKEEKGARASHNINVYDYNGDGVDELFYGERMISLADGHDVICYDEETFAGHSDVVQPFYDREGNYYVYTCRENGSYIGCDRVVTFDRDGNSVWRALRATDESGMNHIHLGFVATVKPDYRKLAVAAANGHKTDHVFFFDALTGEPVDFSFPCPIASSFPLDINGDGYHEFYYRGTVYDCEGKVLAETGCGNTAHIVKLSGLAGEQMLVIRGDKMGVELWGDDEAVDSEPLKARYARGFHRHMAKLRGAGYNFMPTVTCSM